MKCDFCRKDFEEKDIHESHDVPCYLFEGLIGISKSIRRRRKQEADKYGRHYLCKDCHDKYENELREYLRLESKKFCELYFKKRGENEHG